MPYVLLVFTLLSSLCTAAGFHDYETHDPAPVPLTQDDLDRYLLGQQTRSERGQALAPADPADAIEKGLLAVLAVNDIAETQAINGRRIQLMHSIKWWARDLSAEQKLMLAPRLKPLADRALRAFKNKWRSGDDVVDLFDTLDLWSDTNWWFFEIPKNDGHKFIEKHRVRIQRLLPQLGDAERRTLLEQLRAIRPRTETTMTLLNHLLPLNGEELRDYFKSMARRFESRGHVFYVSSREVERREADAVFLNPTARLFLQKLQAGDPQTRIAFEKARSFTERNGEKSLFFSNIIAALPDGDFSHVLAARPCRALLAGPAAVKSKANVQD